MQSGSRSDLFNFLTVRVALGAGYVYLLCVLTGSLDFLRLRWLVRVIILVFVSRHLTLTRALISYIKVLQLSKQTVGWFLILIYVPKLKTKDLKWGSDRTVLARIFIPILHSKTKTGEKSAWDIKTHSCSHSKIIKLKQMKHDSLFSYGQFQEQIEAVIIFHSKFKLEREGGGCFRTLAGCKSSKFLC